MSMYTKEVKLDADLVSLGADDFDIKNLPLLQLQGAKYSLSSLQLSHLAFIITFYLNTPMNINPFCWLMGISKYYLLMFAGPSIL